MALIDANARLFKYLFACMTQFLVVQCYMATYRRIGNPMHMSDKPPTVANSEKRQFNFKELIEKCSENAVYTTAVRAAAQYLHSSDILTQAGVNSVIKIYGLAAMVDDAVEVLSVAESKGVSLNVRHYNAVINVCRQHRRYDEAVAVYERLLMASSSVPNKSNSKGSSFLYPDIASRSSMIGVFGHQGDWQRALNIFGEVKAHERDTVLYTTILCTLEKNQRTLESLEVFEEMIMMSNKRRNTLNNSTEIEVIHDSSMVSKDNKSSVNNADKVSVTVIPTLQMYTSIISVLGKNGDWEKCWTLFQNMQKSQGAILPLKPDKVLVFTMVRILEKAGQLQKAALVKQNSLKYSYQLSSYEDGYSPPNFNDLIREGKRSGNFKAAVAAADGWLASNRCVWGTSRVV